MSNLQYKIAKKCYILLTSFNNLGFKKIEEYKNISF